MKKEDKMSSTDENKQQSGSKQEKKTEEPEDWVQLIVNFIKNPITTGVTGLAAGYFLGTFKASKDIEAIKAEHKLQMTERDEQFKLLLREIRSTHRLITSRKVNEISNGNEDIEDEENEDGNTLAMQQDKGTKVYKYHPKKKKIFELKA